MASSFLEALGNQEKVTVLNRMLLQTGNATRFR